MILLEDYRPCDECDALKIEQVSLAVREQMHDNGLDSTLFHGVNREEVEQLISSEQDFVFGVFPICLNAVTPMDNPLLGYMLCHLEDDKDSAYYREEFNLPVEDNIQVGFLKEMAVSPSFQKEGIGSNLLFNAIKWAICNKCACLVGLYPINSQAIAKLLEKYHANFGKETLIFSDSGIKETVRSFCISF